MNNLDNVENSFKEFYDENTSKEKLIEDILDKIFSDGVKQFKADGKWFSRQEYKELMEKGSRDEIIAFNSIKFKKIEEAKFNVQDIIEFTNSTRTFKHVCIDLAKHLRDQENIFYKPSEHLFIEIKEQEDKYTGNSFLSLSEIKVSRLANILENKFKFFKDVETKEAVFKSYSTPSKAFCEYALFNDDIIDSLNKVERVINSHLPFIVNNNFFIPNKGYNNLINGFVSQEAPDLKLMSLDKAKNIIYDLLKEFCFKEDIDKTMAIAALLTPACRGLYNQITDRTPIFFYLANREGSGKDYLAGITGIVYEGQKIEDSAIANVDKSNNDSELRKKITSLLRGGRRRFHSSNNKGRIDSAVIEQITQAHYWNDRILGGNKEVTLPNEVDFSLSANTGISWTPDFWRRCRPINLFLDIENVTEREFERPNLEQYVFDNRGIIQSAIVSIIKSWYDAGMPEGKTFTGFVEWSRVVGGIMEFAGFGDPTVTLVDDSVIGGDTETIDFRSLFEMMHNIQKNTMKRVHTVKEIMECIVSEEADMFSNKDFDKKGDRLSFGKSFKKYLGRIFSNIKLNIADNNSKSERITYSFRKVGEENFSSKVKVIDTKKLNVTEEFVNDDRLEIKKSMGDIVEIKPGEYKELISVSEEFVN